MENIFFYQLAIFLDLKLFPQVNSNLIIEFHEKILKEKPNFYSSITDKFQKLLQQLLDKTSTLFIGAQKDF
jgi:hypothetical protein